MKINFILQKKIFFSKNNNNKRKFITTYIFFNKNIIISSQRKKKQSEYQIFEKVFYLRLFLNVLSTMEYIWEMMHVFFKYAIQEPALYSRNFLDVGESLYTTFIWSCGRLLFNSLLCGAFSIFHEDTRSLTST